MKYAIIAPIERNGAKGILSLNLLFLKINKNMLYIATERNANIIAGIKSLPKKIPNNAASFTSPIPIP